MSGGPNTRPHSAGTGPNEVVVEPQGPGTSTFGARLRAHRKALGLTQHQLADASGIGREATIRDYEAGRHDPSGARVVALARALGTTPDVLLLP